MKFAHLISGTAFAAALLVSTAAIPASAETVPCVVTNVVNLKDACPPGMTLAGAEPVMAEPAMDEVVVADEPVMDEPVVTPTAYTETEAGCVKTNVVNLKNACPW